MNKKKIALKTTVSLGIVGMACTCIYVVCNLLGKKLGNVILKIWKK